MVVVLVMVARAATPAAVAGAMFRANVWAANIGCKVYPKLSKGIFHERVNDFGALGCTGTGIWFHKKGGPKTALR